MRSTPSGLTFEHFARAWYALHKARWKPVHVIHSLERDVFPSLGAHDMDEIDAKMVWAILDAAAARGAVETAHRLRQRIHDPAGAGKEADFTISLLRRTLKGKRTCVTDPLNPLPSAKRVSSRSWSDRRQPATRPVR